MKNNKLKKSMIKKSMIFISTAFLFVCGGIRPTLSHADGVGLSLGASGQNVLTLQQNLQTLGYFTFPQLTGNYGALTEQAVEAFQTAYGLPADGVDGSITQTTIQHALTKQQIVDSSYKYIGTPYHWGGDNPSSGFDCSGFVYYLFQSNGVNISRSNSQVLYTMGQSVSEQSLRPGDLMFFDTNKSGSVDHVGIYLGNNQFISAISHGVTVQTYNNDYWGPRYMGAKRIY